MEENKIENDVEVYHDEWARTKNICDSKSNCEMLDWNCLRKKNSIVKDGKEGLVKRKESIKNIDKIEDNTKREGTKRIAEDGVNWNNGY